MSRAVPGEHVEASAARMQRTCMTTAERHMASVRGRTKKLVSTSIYPSEIIFNTVLGGTQRRAPIQDFQVRGLEVSEASQKRGSAPCAVPRGQSPKTSTNFCKNGGQM